MIASHAGKPKLFHQETFPALFTFQQPSLPNLEVSASVHGLLWPTDLDDDLVPFMVLF